MLKIDDSLLQEVGLGTLPDNDKNSLLKHIYETLEMRVGMRLADQMSPAQLDEFEQYFEAKDDTGAFKWLETNFPNYKDIVQEEFDKLKSEVAQSAPQILASSVSNENNNQQQSMPAETPANIDSTDNTFAMNNSANNQQPLSQSQPPMPDPQYSQPQSSQQYSPQTPQYPTTQPPAGPGQVDTNQQFPNQQ